MTTKSLEDIQHLVQQRIANFITANEGQSSIYQPINYLLKAGGKRLRPALSIMAANLFTDDLESAIQPAIAIEVFHNFTLMHDDIMDNAPLRRNMPTVHEKWNTNVAILSGDAMLIQAYQLLIQTKPQCIEPIMETFNLTGLEVCIGQQMDMDFEKRTDVSAAEYMEMIRLKTSVLLAAAMKIGGIAAGADHASQKLLYDLGIALGLAFQLKDDYLDAFGEPGKTGKQAGGDILADKKTLLMLTAIEESNSQQKKVLDQYIGNPSAPSEEKVRAILEVFEQLNLREKMNNLIENYHLQADQALEQIEVPEIRKEQIQKLSKVLQNRNH